MAAEALAGAIRVMLSVDTSAFDSGLSSAQRSLKSVSKTLTTELTPAVSTIGGRLAEVAANAGRASSALAAVGSASAALGAVQAAAERTGGALAGIASRAGSAAEAAGSALGGIAQSAGAAIKPEMFVNGFKAAGAAAVAAGAAYVNFSARTAAAVTEVAQMSSRLGITGQAFQALRVAASQAGSSPQQMTDALLSLNGAMSAFNAGAGGPAAQAFDRLGLSSQVASGQIKTADQAFFAIAGAMEGVSDPTERARLAVQLFGAEAGPGMLTMLSQGEQGLRSMTAAAGESGRVMSEEASKTLTDMTAKLQMSRQAVTDIAMAANVELLAALAPLVGLLPPLISGFQTFATMTVEQLEPAFSGLAVAIVELMQGPFGQALGETAMAIGNAMIVGIGMAVGVVTALVNGISGLVTWFQSLDPAIQTGLLTFVGLTAAVVAGSAAFGILMSGLQALRLFMVASMLPSLLGLATAFAPVTLVIAGISLAVAGFLYYKEPIIAFCQQVISWVGDKLGAVWETVKGAWSAAGAYISQIVGNLVNGIGGIFQRLLGFFADPARAWETVKSAWSAARAFISETVGSLVNGVGGFFQRLLGFFAGPIAKIKELGDAFFRLYRAVVGNSYVPDMVDGIRDNFALLPRVMVGPATAAVNGTLDRFRQLPDAVKDIMKSIASPADLALEQYMADMAVIDNARARSTDPLTQEEYENLSSGVRENAIRNFDSYFSRYMTQEEKENSEAKEFEERLTEYSRFLLADARGNVDKIESANRAINELRERFNREVTQREVERRAAATAAAASGATTTGGAGSPAADAGAATPSAPQAPGTANTPQTPTGIAAIFADTPEAKEKFRKIASDGIKAALNGELSTWLEKKWQEILSKALDKAVNAAADGLFELFQLILRGAPGENGAQGSGGVLGFLKGLFGRSGDAAPGATPSAPAGTPPIVPAGNGPGAPPGGVPNGLMPGANDWLSQILSRLGTTFSTIFQPLGRIFSTIFQSAGGIFSSIFKSVGSFASGFTSLFGFATGGSFRVGGVGGTDSQMIAFRATPGEMVDIRTPGQDRGGGGGQILIPISLGGTQIETIMVDIARQEASVVTGAALQSVGQANRRRQTYSRF